MSLAETGELPITDEKMARFMISLKKALISSGGPLTICMAEIYVKKIPSMNIMDIAKTVAPDAGHRIIGIRPGEKLHEQMIGAEDADHTYEYDGYYKILPAINMWSQDPERIGEGKKVTDRFSYTSDQNTEWMSVDELQQWIDKYRSSIGKI